MLPSFTEFYRVLPSFTEFYRVLPSFTAFYWFNSTFPTKPHSTRFQWVQFNSPVIDFALFLAKFWWNYWLQLRDPTTVATARSLLSLTRLTWSDWSARVWYRPIIGSLMVPYSVRPVFIELYRVVPSCTRFYLVLPGFTGFSPPTKTNSLRRLVSKPSLTQGCDVIGAGTQ